MLPKLVILSLKEEGQEMMSKMSKQEYLNELRPKYKKAGRKQKSQLLSDFCDFSGYHRKHALRLLNSPPRASKKSSSCRRSRTYDQITINALLVIWSASNKICAERLQPYIPEMMEKLVECRELEILPETKNKLLRISASTVKRIVHNEKNRSRIKIGGTTRPGSLLKSQIEIRYGRWKETDPGWCEADTVAHCGDSMKGDFVFSVDIVDISSGWSEQEAIWGKGEMATTKGIDNMRSRLPFPLVGIDPDNGGEFINWSLYRYCLKHQINFTRSRPFHKNDNAHVEQKNWTAIRQLAGYSRLDQKEHVSLLNDLYQNEWRLYLNFFQPIRKQKKNIRNLATGKVVKQFDQARTPYQRLMEHPKITERQREMLQSTYQQLNPVKLLAEIDRKVKLIERTLR